MKEAVIVSGVRTAVGRAKRGTLVNVRGDEMAAAVIAEVVRRTPGLKPEDVEDVFLGCSNPEAEQGLNMARLAALRAGLPHTVPGTTINRFCSSGLQAIASGAQAIMTGLVEVVIAGGAESMSMIPMVGNKLAPNPWLAENWPGVYLNMGLTAERVAKEYNISRQDQDALGVRSNELAIAAQRAGKFKEEIMPLEVETTDVDEEGRLRTRKIIFDADEGPRPGTTMETLAALRPAFAQNGTVTAGNSSQMSDGAAAVVLMERKRAEAMGIKPLMRFVSFAVAGVPPEIMGVGPIYAIPKALKVAGLTLNDIDLIELNEAFASQALACVRKLELNMDIVNVNGGAIALGHPLGCTGAKLTVQLMHEMKRRGGRYGLVSMCVGMGQGAAGIFENLQ